MKNINYHNLDWPVISSKLKKEILQLYHVKGKVEFLENRKKELARFVAIVRVDWFKLCEK